VSTVASTLAIGARVPVRYRILGVLLALGFVNYLLRNNISVAMPSIAEEFGYTNAQRGWIFASFSIGYALFQIPGGLLGLAIGPRRALALNAAAWGLLTFLTGFVPAVFASSALAALLGLMVVRFLTGATHAPIFPVSAGAIERWFPVGHWAFPNAMQSFGLCLGQACIGPIVTFLIVAVGWRASFYWLAPLGFAVAAGWWLYARDHPREHRAVEPPELALIEAGRDGEFAGDTAEAQEADRAASEAAAGSRAAGALTTTSRLSSAGLRAVLLDRNVLVLATSYFCMNCVFYMFADWLFTYLVEERKFSLLASGLLFALPFVVGAVGAALGGLTCDALCRRIGPRWGCRLPAIVALTMVALLLFAGARATDPYWAVVLLALCFGFTQFADSTYWGGATYAGRRQTSATSGVMNTGGNLPGFLAPLVGWAIDHFGWLATLAGGSVMAMLAAGLWLLVDVSRGPPRSELAQVG
jgi:ACS family glucarate transporter-like MFS transporter